MHALFGSSVTLSAPTTVRASVVAAALIEVVATTTVLGSTMARHVSLVDMMTRGSWTAPPPPMGVDGDGVALEVAVGDDDAAAGVLRCVSSFSNLRPLVEVSHWIDPHQCPAAVSMEALLESTSYPTSTMVGVEARVHREWSPQRK